MLAPAPPAVSTALIDARHAPAVRWWLIAVGLLVLAIVLVGGATRLTDSGLSIVEWRPITGVIPPLSEAAWLVEFEKYRQIPEYQLVNRGMSLDAFKVIYWWEWGHRFLGRLIGIVFFVPLVVFWWRGWFARPYALKLLGLFALGGLQGAIGWWMVSSGLVERTDVSQYRLAVHLTLATVILALIVRLVLDLSPREAPVAAAQRQRGLAHAILALLLVQTFLGGLVAGLDAGLAYPTWPLMDGALIPPADALYAQTPAWRNHFENVLTVQWQHRMAGYLITGLVAWHAIVVMRSAPGTAAAGGARLLLAATAVQVALGVATLLLAVPVWAALAHQGLAMVLVALCVRQIWLLAPAPESRAAAMPA